MPSKVVLKDPVTKLGDLRLVLLHGVMVSWFESKSYSREDEKKNKQSGDLNTDYLNTGKIRIPETIKYQTF